LSWSFIIEGFAVLEKWQRFLFIEAFAGDLIGGAATVIDVPTLGGKALKSITVRTLSNTVVIGMMSVTLMR